MIRSIDPQDGPADLVPNPHRLTLRGSARDAAFPPMCPNCGGAADKAIACSKVFRRADEDSVSYLVETVAVPFCDACIARHRAQEQRPSWFELLRTRLRIDAHRGCHLPRRWPRFSSCVWRSATPRIARACAAWSSSALQRCLP